MVLRRDPDKAAAKAEAKQQRREAKQREDEERARQEAEAAFLESPQGRARTARGLGQRLFQISLPLLSTERTPFGLGDIHATRTTRGDHQDVLSSVEEEGWRLEHAGYVFRETGSVSRDKFLSSGQEETVTGEVLGIYVFRAVE
jgi:hypothetical protein